MKGFFKFFGGLVGALVIVVLAIWAVMSYWAWMDNQPTSAVSAIQSSPSADSQGVFGPHRYFYTKQGGGVAATFSPILPGDDATVVGAIRSVVRSAYGANISAVSPVLTGQEIAFASPTTTYYVMLVKETSGEVHSFRIRTSP